MNSVREPAEAISDLIEAGRIEIQSRAAQAGTQAAERTQKQAAEKAARWQPFLDGLRERLPAWTHAYLSVGADDPTNQGTYETIRLWPAMLVLPDCAPIYLYALHTRDGWRFAIEAARYALSFDDDDGDWWVVDEAGEDRPLRDLQSELEPSELAVAAAQARDAALALISLQAEADQRNSQDAARADGVPPDDLRRAQMATLSGNYVQAGLFVAIALVKELRAGRQERRHSE